MPVVEKNLWGRGGSVVHQGWLGAVQYNWCLCPIICMTCWLTKSPIFVCEEKRIFGIQSGMFTQTECDTLPNPPPPQHTH